MNLQRKITAIFQSKYPELVKNIENTVYSFLEGMLTKKNIDLQKLISYDNSSFREDLYKIVNTIGLGLNTIGIPNDQIEIYFKNEYRFFRADKTLLNYHEWISHEFKDKINFLILSEILEYFTGKEGNIIDKMIELSLISADLKENLNEIEKKNPNLTKYLSWQKNLEKKLNEMILNSDKLASIYEFNYPEHDLLFLYNLFVLAKIFGLESKINLIPAVNFLVGKVDCWSVQNENITLIHPTALYAGFYLVHDNDIDIDKSICQKQIEKMRTNILINKISIFSSPYLVNHMIELMKISNMTLTSEFTESITVKDGNFASLSNLRLKNTSELGLILLLYKQLGFYKNFNEVENANFLKIIKERSSDGLFFEANDSKTFSIESLMGGFSILSETRNLNVENINFGEFLDHIIDEINRLTKNMNFEDSDNLGKLILAIQLMEKIDLTPKYPDSFVADELEKYIFTENLQKSGEDSSKTNGDNITSNEQDADQNDEIADVILFSGDNDTQEDNNEKENTSTSDQDQVNKEELLGHCADDIISFHIDLPNLTNQAIDDLQINYQAITKPPEHITESLEKLFHFVAIEKLLRINHHFDKSEIDNICRDKFYVKINGFGEQNNDNSDVISTYYGLMIYNEYGMMGKLDLNKIHDFLANELKFFNVSKIYKNKFLFLCFKILSVYGINSLDYVNIIDKLKTTDYSISDEYHPLFDIYDQMIVLKTLSPKENLKDNIMDNYLELVKSSLDFDGSINGIISDTAIVLLTMELLDLIDKEPEICQRMSEFIVNYGIFFNPSLETQHIAWGIDELGYSMELQMLFWGLFALGVSNPAKTDLPNPHICPECGTYFKNLPKTCNICGWPLLPSKEK